MKRAYFLASLVMLLVFAVAFFAQPVMAQEMEDPTVAPTVPFLEQWQGSAHAAFDTEPFRHWDEDDPAEVPTSCAKCHSSPGYLDYLGADGTEANVVDNPAPIGTVVDCVACHNDVTLVKDSVIMPSGIELTGLGDESRCMECHQGRESTVSVNERIAAAGVEDDVVSEDLGFANIHYYPAAATKYGTLAKGGYEFDGMSYDGFFAHVDGYETCIGCHNTHTLEVKVNECATCHTDVAGVEDLKNVRMAGSLKDYDGDGNVEEGIYYELEGLQELLSQAMQAYGSEVSGSPIGYNADAYPYFFIDANGDGEITEDETERYASWTPRLLKAAYNYQMSVKDPGAFAHGGKYIIELLYDSIEQLNSAIAEPIDMTAASRIDSGHFAGSEEAFRHWDEEGAVPGSCAKCHGATGLATFLTEGVNVSEPLPNGFQCSNCHNDLVEFTRYEVADVTFPSGATIDSGDQNTNLCMNCHQGRQSTVSVNNSIGDLGPDEVSDALGFLNVHYFSAGATRYGTEAKGAYEYDGKEYLGYFEHVDEASQCVDCHGAHALEVDYELCAECHDDIDIESKEDLANIRYYFDDWDGDGDSDEGVAGEIGTLQEMLLAAMQEYAANEVGTAIGYDAHSYPYFFVDADGNGVIDEGETDRYSTWTPRLLRAAYNYQYVNKDPGAFAHNGLYIIQILQDSLEDLGVDVSGMIRP